MAEADKERAWSLSSPEYRRRLCFLLKKFKDAVRCWRLFEEGDRILLGLSGGKDSTSLAHLMHHWQAKSKLKFHFEAVHVEIDGAQANDEKRELLGGRMLDLGVPFRCLSMKLPEVDPRGRRLNRCFLCAWNRRKAMFRYAGEQGFNKVALAHHLDDAVETTLMNLLFRGNLETMEPRLSFFDGRLTVIRPLILAEEKEIARFGRTLGFPFFGCACPGEHPRTERNRVREFIRSFGRRNRAVKSNLWRAARIWSDSGLSRVWKGREDGGSEPEEVREDVD